MRNDRTDLKVNITSVAQASPQFLFSAVSQNAVTSPLFRRLLSSLLMPRICSGDRTANICHQFHKYSPTRFISPVWVKGVTFFFPPRVLATSKVFFKNVLSTFRQSIRTVCQQVLALKFIVISDPPSLTFFLSGLVLCLFCPGMAGWARWWEVKKICFGLRPFPLFTTVSSFSL